MLRKLRRLRVPVCFYTCCSLCAILLFGCTPRFQWRPTYVPAHRARAQLKSPPASSEKKQPHLAIVEPNTYTEAHNDDVDVIKKYISDNFVGHPPPKPQPAASETGEAQSTQNQQPKQNTIVISNLVKLAQQASNNPNVFNNLNSLTGDDTNALTHDDEFSQMFMESQTTTVETDLSYPGGDATTQIRKRERQWFMSGGDYFPTPPGGLTSIFYPSSAWLASKPSSLDYANLWYDNNIGSDRVIDQLMFAIDDPINYANISWGFEEGPTATTVKPFASASSSTNEPKTQRFSKVSQAKHLDLSPANVAHLLTGANTHQIPAKFIPSSSKGGRNLAATGSISTLRDPRLGKIKTILLYYGLGMSWGSHITNGRQVFLQQKCPINACRLTGNRAQLSKADIVVFKDVFMHPKIRRPPGQLWIMYMLECPLNTQNFLEKNAFNLTATYRHDSDIVTPYEKWVYFDDAVRSLPQAINYAEGKTKKVAWFVSNCVAKNNRLEYARELAKYIEVDIYGACGSHTCSRANSRQCFEMLSKNYKFYLAFENSNCRDYVSEKFFVNGLGNNVLPIVMGAHPDDYKRVAPDRSYIHVDDFSSPKELAQYLHELDTNDDLYNEYFKWKGTGEFINTHFFCRLCAMAHYSAKIPRKPSHYEDFNRWWRGPHVCTRQSWRSTPDIFAQENYDSIISTNQI
ncbi:Glycoprotein 3-alpha-L-fucosyltransferase A [Orchesella cincta]|uniref:Fucosyltransferase n=1 Tax=Orchesella cincta TaxID=48709 RepID=A0A1D2NMK0_ORCCI|nr:Glycoprotein 3-alpha-L-fucosyltransferase A [Orchesella cincta]